MHVGADKCLDLSELGGRVGGISLGCLELLVYPAQYSSCPYVPLASFPVDISTLATSVVEGLLAVLPGPDNVQSQTVLEGREQSVRSAALTKITVDVGVSVLLFLLTPPDGTAYTDSDPEASDSASTTDRQRHTVAEIVLDSGVMQRLVPAYEESDCVHTLFASVIRTLGLSGYEYPSEVLDLCGLTSLVHLSVVTEAPLPSYIEVPLRKASMTEGESDSLKCHGERTISPTLPREWALFLEHVLVYAQTDIYVLDDLVALLESEEENPVFRTCMSEGVERALFHLVPDPQSATLPPVMIRLAAHIIIRDVSLSRDSSLGKDSYVPLSCTRSLLESGIIHTIHSWLGLLIDSIGSGDEDDSVDFWTMITECPPSKGLLGRLTDTVESMSGADHGSGVVAIVDACADVLGGLSSNIQTRMLVRRTTLVEEWLSQDVKRLRNNGLLNTPTLHCFQWCLGQLDLSGFDEFDQVAQSEALEILYRYPGSRLLPVIMSQVNHLRDQEKCWFFLTDSEFALLKEHTNPSKDFKDTLVRNSEAPLFAGLVNVLGDPRGNTEERAEICRMLLQLLAKHLPLSYECGDACASDPVLFHFHRLGVHEHLLRYTASVTPEGNVGDDTLEHMCNWACSLCYMCTVLALPQRDTLRDTLIHFLSTHTSLVEELVRVGVGMQQQLTHSVEEWLEERGAELDVGLIEEYNGYLSLPTRLERLTSHMVQSLLSTGGELRQAVCESTFLMEVSRIGEVDVFDPEGGGDYTLAWVHLGLGSLAQEVDFWPRIWEEVTLLENSGMDGSDSDWM
ncbi:hypothetical protein KIPB_004652 [Kipferlia bialata]|uniref:Ig-like domain-containing protein n=1 Tax=Kipferlia bialata TaxID=797122 RepID=A0A9K3CVR9_9EUKA|nr:hypothetical protein KIPB_004652 [Kipferlia bialata]|eukprot:g4652.t1